MYDNMSRHLKQAAEQQVNAGTPQDMCNVQGAALGRTDYYRPSLLDEISKRHAQASDDVQKLGRGLDFLRDHPEFDEFIGLLRSGSISI